MRLPIFHLAVLAELAWAGFGSLRWRLGLGQPGGWRALVWLAGALAIMLLATLLATLRQRPKR